ncbi:hypothetical protein K466DRAFT_567607 [Polyporus arcularius HHB13444]|uniref:Uncharacterized protein n=1 Tax=Polyporus arcularius HHB13444 TaxID=1314778 RepID=A0A5C3P483_9APHY|nr:hypothetical protein K466DRAFT_567607 [Polyporus arcularius HHB13444]
MQSEDRQGAIREKQQTESLPALLDSDEVQEWLVAKQAFRNAAPRLQRDALQEQHSKAALKFHMATLRVLEVYRDVSFWTKIPTEDITSLATDAAMARILALEKNERRLTLEYEAVVALTLYVQAEAASLSYACANRHLPAD